MSLSIVIVNYNVKQELEQCIQSVLVASQNIDSEIIIVDNNSTDDSVDMIHKQFDNICCIENKENKGFSQACNQAIRISTKKYILLLNPDTIVQPDTFKLMLNFMEENIDCGGLGVKMVDKNGLFLPESKRGIPTPWVAFCKISGLYRLFPKSDKFNHYYMGALSVDEVHETEILAGACMMLRKSVLDKIGLLNEQYFLYGEDIDLSYRIILAGFKNYYFPLTSIVHYKARSTRKSGLRCIVEFHKSMIIFANQYFGTNRQTPYAWFIKSVVWIRAGIALALSAIRKSFS